MFPDLNLLKKKKPRSMLPLSTSMDHRPKEDLLQDCITLASVKHSNGEPESAVERFGLVIILQRDTFYKSELIDGSVFFLCGAFCVPSTNHVVLYKFGQTLVPFDFSCKVN